MSERGAVADRQDVALISQLVRTSRDDGSAGESDVPVNKRSHKTLITLHAAVLDHGQAAP